MSDIYFTSDRHWYHANVIKYCNRPYANVEEMNWGLVKEYNSVVKKDDTVYDLGDFSLAIRPVEIFPMQLNGTTKYLIPGNHDWCHPSNKKSRNPDGLKKWTNKYNECGLEVLPIFSTLDIPGVAVVNMCHMPYRGDSTDDRFQDFRMVDDGRVLLCGHVHEKWKTKRTPKGTLMINVGVDVWDMKPVHIDTIKDIILNEHLYR